VAAVTGMVTNGMKCATRLSKDDNEAVAAEVMVEVEVRASPAQESRRRLDEIDITD